MGEFYINVPQTNRFLEELAKQFDAYPNAIWTGRQLAERMREMQVRLTKVEKQQKEERDV